MSGAKKIYAALVFLGLVLVYGSVGYAVLEHVDPMTAVYMTVITISTVGYSEIVPLDPAGRMFTITLIFSGLACTTLLTVSLVAFFVEGEFRLLFQQAWTKSRISRMKNHFIICGLGQAGRSVLAEFMAVKADCVVVEKSPAVIEEIMKLYPGLIALAGDATTDEMLAEAGVEKARGLIAATESDSDNLLITLTARSMNPKIVITARVIRTENYNKLRVAGANHVVMPNAIGGARMASTLLRPEVVGFLDVMMRSTGETLRMEQASIPKGSPSAGKTLQEMEIPKKTGMIVLAIKRASGQYTFNPTSNERLEPGDVLIVVAPAEKMPVLQDVILGRA
ncbi:MAG TPA: potassium channel protein [bacterium]|nr:potassium channel protein [bacterium]